VALKGRKGTADGCAILHSVNKTTNRGLSGHSIVTIRRHNASTSGEQSTATLGGTAEPVTAAEVPRPLMSGLFYFYSFISNRSCVLMYERVVVRLVSVSVPSSTMVVAEVSGASAFDSDSLSFSSGLKVHSA
jgi:hypothetical protein